MFDKIRIMFNRIIKKYKKHFVSVKMFDLKRADEFLQTYKNELVEMTLCMGFDDFISLPIVENGMIVNLPVGVDSVDGVTYTIRDVPCIYYVLKSGTEGKFYCYTEYEKDLKSGLCKYRNPLYGSMLKHYFGVFKEEEFENGISILFN